MWPVTVSGQTRNQKPAEAGLLLSLLLSPVFTLQLVELLVGAVLVDELHDSLSVVQHLHHGLPSLCDLIHHQFTALHVPLHTNTHTCNQIHISRSIGAVMVAALHFN